MWIHSIAVRDFVSGVHPRARLLLYAIACRCNEGGWCRPTIRRLMEDTGMSKNSVMRAVSEAVASGHLVQIGGPYSGGSNRYQINPDFMCRLHEAKASESGADEDEVINNQSQIGTGTGVKTVDKQSQNGTPHPSQNGTPSPKMGHPPSQIETPPVPNWDPKRILEEDFRSDSICGEGGANLGRVVDNSAETGAPDYARLLRTPGWRPANGRDRKAAEDLCFDLGATREAAADFGRYNAMRNWAAINGTSTVNDLARTWVERFKLENRAAYEYEQSIRAAERESRVLD